MSNEMKKEAGKAMRGQTLDALFLAREKTAFRLARLERRKSKGSFIPKDLVEDHVERLESIDFLKKRKEAQLKIAARG